MKRERMESIQRIINDGRITVKLDEGRVFYKSGRECCTVDSCGYYHVGVREGKKTGNYRVHEIIAIVMGLDVLGNDINHIDGNKLNNKPENLEAISRKDNLLHAMRTGLSPQIGSGHITNNKITKEVAEEIKQLINQGVKYSVISEKYGIAQSTISNIKHGRRWK